MGNSRQRHQDCHQGLCDDGRKDGWEQKRGGQEPLQAVLLCGVVCTELDGFQSRKDRGESHSGQVQGKVSIELAVPEKQQLLDV